MRAFCLLLLAVATQVADVRAQDCFADIGNCIKELRGLMTSESAFWFGEDFERRCVKFGQRIPNTKECENPSLGLSVMARFLNSTDFPADIADSLTLADVVFNVPEGSYNGCGQDIYAPPVYNHRVDPLKITEVSGWSLEHTPAITWTPKNESTYYSVLVWDVGFLYLHGFYVNARGGNLDDATPIYAYGGPRNPRPTANLFLFVVIEQFGYVDPATVGRTVWAVIDPTSLNFYPTLLLAALPDTWGAPVAANLMSVRGDTYSVEWQKRHFIVNYCPVLLSMEDELRTVLTEAKIEVDWSYELDEGNQRGPLFAEEVPYIHSLEVDVNVEYRSMEMTIESCCTKMTYTESLYRVSPYEMTSPALTRDKPRVELTPIFFLYWNDRPTEKYYTLMMVDMTDAAYMRAEHDDFIVHWMVTDIAGAVVRDGNEEIPYAGPIAADMYNPDVMVFLLFEQNAPKLENFDQNNYLASKCRDNLANRCGIRINDIVKDYDMVLAGINWFKAKQDAYARKMIYESLSPQPMVNLCDGLPGFEDPCPVYGIMTAHASTLTPSLGLFLLVAAAAISKLLEAEYSKQLNAWYKKY